MGVSDWVKKQAVEKKKRDQANRIKQAKKDQKQIADMKIEEARLRKAAKTQAEKQRLTKNISALKTKTSSSNPIKAGVGGLKVAVTKRRKRQEHERKTKTTKMDKLLKKIDYMNVKMKY